MKKIIKWVRVYDKVRQKIDKLDFWEGQNKSTTLIMLQPMITIDIFSQWLVIIASPLGHIF